MPSHDVRRAQGLDRLDPIQVSRLGLVLGLVLASMITRCAYPSTVSLDTATFRADIQGTVQSWVSVFPRVTAVVAGLTRPATLTSRTGTLDPKRWLLDGRDWAWRAGRERLISRSRPKKSALRAWLT